MAEDLLKGLPIFLDRTDPGHRDVQAGRPISIGLTIGSSACSSSVSARAPVEISPPSPAERKQAHLFRS
jgi:hypothetical protein